MVLKTGMLVGIVGTGDMGVLIQIRASSNTCVIKLNNGTLKKNIPLEDVEEARDMSDTKEKKSPIRLGEGDNSPTKSPGKLAALSVDHRRSTDNLSTLNSLNVGDSVRARCNGGSRWFPGEILRVNRDGTFDVEYTDGDIERKMAAADVEAASKSPVGATSSRKRGFAVGDKIKARYKNGTKLFGGEISRVRSDGTYDIKYDDGDVETRVAEASIEESSRRKNESDDEIPARRKSKSDGFRVDQSVKARYKGGKKMFAGKIKRVHSDGTYDIRYDDGDEEKRVKAENIEASGDLNVDDNDLGKVKGASSRTRTLTVGKKVKARYKKGRRLFPGKISRVRSDGTYDIDYDDGEIEFRVEASQIEVSDNDDEDMFADSDDDKKHKPSAPAKKCSWEVGDRVKAFYGKGKRLLPGRIVKVHINGTYDIRYQDGDSETRVDASLIREEDSDIQQSTKTKGSPVSASNISTKRKLRVGDAVKAKYRGGAKLFPGKITRERLDGTFDIRYEDGDSEERVKAEFIQPAYGSDDEADLKTSKKKKISFEVDDIVKAPFQRGSKLFRGKISRARSDGTYDVVFDDGDRDTHVPGDLIQAEEQPGTRDTITKNRALKVGDVVKARYKKGKKVFPGKVTRVRSDGTYDIEYDDGDVEMRVDAEMIEFSESMKREDDDNDRSTSKKVLKVGDKVRARYNKGSKMLRGVITATHRDGTYDVRYDDGDKEKYVEAKNIELAEEQDEHLPSKKSPEKIKVGDLVEANYKNGVKMFAGKISRMHSDGTYDIAFNDGDVDRRVPRSRIKLQDAKADQHKSSPKAKRGFSVGDTVKAKYKNGTKFFTGKISRVRSDGTFDIEYDDGDKEAHVDAARIVAVESDSPRRDRDATKKFEVGDVVKARYKKGSKLFAGKISRVRSDGTFDIKYDDGDVETHVESTLIESEHIASSKSRDSGDEKKKLGFAEGDTVKARYKGGVKMYPGKILKARLDGTFDIQFDDGDVELRVKSNAIEAIVDSKPTKSKGEAKAGVDKDDIFGDSDSDGKGPSGSNQKPIKVGDAVDANFKQKGKFHRGKVVRVHSDSTFDIEYDVGASEKRVRSADIKRINEKQESGDDSDVEKRDTAKKQIKGSPRVQSSDSDKEVKKKKKSAKKAKTHSSSESSASDRVKLMPLKKGVRVTYRKGEDMKSRRVGVVRRVHSDGSCDIKYDDGEKVKRVAKKLLAVCSASEDSDDSESKVLRKRGHAKPDPSFRRHERVLANWHRSSKLSKPKMTSKWSKATVLEKNADGTYTIRYSDGVVEEDVPLEALKPNKEKHHGSSFSDESDTPERRKRAKRSRGSGIGTESLFLLEQLAMTLFEEGVLKKKPRLVLLRSATDSSSSGSSSASSGSESEESSNSCVDKVLKRLFDSGTLQSYRRMFKKKDTKGAGKISKNKIIGIVEELMAASKPANGTGHSASLEDDQNTISHILKEWFGTHDDLRTHRNFEFKTLMLAFAYAKSRVGKLRIEQSVATVLEGRFATYHENRRQLELWQQKLGFRLFETLQRHFHQHALPNMIPSRIRASALALIFEDVSRGAIPNKPLDVYLQQHQLFPHNTLMLPEFLCCYYQLYGSVSAHPEAYSSNRALELRPVAFVASCLFSNGDTVCRRHGDLVRRLSVGRTQVQLDLILHFREAFESLLSTNVDTSGVYDEPLLATTLLSAFAARVAPDPTLLEPAMNLLRKRSAAVSLVEVYASCGFIIDELTAAPTIKNAVEKMRMRVDLVEVRRIISLTRNICLKILRFPNNADYWRIRADSAAFQQKIGRFDGATSLLEAVGFVEYQKAYYELRGARTMGGKRVATLEKLTLDKLREKCVELDRELSLFDGVESISSILQRISQVRESEGNRFTLDECQSILKYLSTYIENVLKNPKDSRCWRIRESNTTFQRQIGYLPLATELMESIGFDLTQSSHGNAFVLRGTNATNSSRSKGSQEVSTGKVVSASLSNFSFTSVSSHTEWFMCRRKQEIESLLEDEMRYLHDIVGSHSLPQNTTAVATDSNQKPSLKTSETREAAILRVYPYGTNAVEAFNSTSVQRHQLDTMKWLFDKLDVNQKGFLLETDFVQAYGPASTLPACARFEAFDIGKDGKVDFADFVAALGPLLDHSYELAAGKNGEMRAAYAQDDSEPTLCEATSLAVGDLRLGTSNAEAGAALEALFGCLYNITQEPGNQSLWVINEKTAISSKLFRFPAGRALLKLAGFRGSNDTAKESVTYELQPHRVRFNTSQSPSEPPQSLDTATISRLQTITAMLGGHYRGLKHPAVSDISAVSRAIAVSHRSSESWIRLVQLASKCLENIVREPENPRYRELNTTTNTYTNIVGSVQGGLQLLVSVGFRETESGSLLLSPDTLIGDVKARLLELDVGLALLRSTSTVNKQVESRVVTDKLSQRDPEQPIGQDHANGNNSHGALHKSKDKRKELKRRVKISCHNQAHRKQRGKATRAARGRPATANPQPANQTQRRIKASH